MSEAAPQSDAARRAAARKAKILARGNTGLAKLAQTARGDEAETLYGQDLATSSNPSSSSASPNIPGTPAEPNTANQSWAPPRPTSTATSQPVPSAHSQPQSPEQQAITAQLEAMMSMFGGPSPSGPGMEGIPDMRQMMAAMMGGMGGEGIPADRLLGDLDDPAGLGSVGGGGIPPNPFAGMGLGDALSGGGYPGMGLPGMSGGQRVKSKTERYFPLIHFLSVLSLLLFIVGWWEPTLRNARWGGRVLDGIVAGSGGSGWSSRWAALSPSRIGGIWGSVKSGLGRGAVEQLPVFWAFTTLELILQTTRFMILKSPPPPHSLISTFLPLLPPRIPVPLVTGSRYLTLLSQLYKDGCLLVFGVGMVIVLASWLNGGVVV